MKSYIPFPLEEQYYLLLQKWVLDMCLKQFSPFCFLDTRNLLTNLLLKDSEASPQYEESYTCLCF